MRKGYWKTLLRELRSRVATGGDTFRFHDAPLKIVEILASDDDTLDPACALPLAATANGAVLLIDTGNSLVVIRSDNAAQAESTGLDLPAFINALTVDTAGRADGMLGLDDAVVADMLLPARSKFLGD